MQYHHNHVQLIDGLCIAYNAMLVKPQTKNRLFTEGKITHFVTVNSFHMEIEANAERTKVTFWSVGTRVKGRHGMVSFDVKDYQEFYTSGFTNTACLTDKEGHVLIVKLA